MSTEEELKDRLGDKKPGVQLAEACVCPWPRARAPEGHQRKRPRRLPLVRAGSGGGVQGDTFRGVFFCSF